MASEVTARRLSRVAWGGCLLLSLAAAVALPLPSVAALEAWRDLALQVAIAVLTIAAIWLGMLFGVAMERARSGSGSGASSLVLHLMRPLRAAALTLIGLLLLVLASPYLAQTPVPPEWKAWALRARVFLHLALASSALYGLLLALAPVHHILLLLRSEEAASDAHPPAATAHLATPEHKEAWRG